MAKHELDNEVDDILKHWGIQGMKWDVRRTPEQIKSDAKNGVDAAGEALENAGDEVLGNDSIMKELGDVLDIVFGGKGDIKKQTDQLKDAVKDKVQDVSKDIKKRGYVMLERIFGKSENKTTITTTIVKPPNKSSKNNKKSNLKVVEGKKLSNKTIKAIDREQKTR